jgi:hypothetical protein
MLIETRFVGTGDLELNAYTHSADEFKSLEIVLKKAGSSSEFQSLPPGSGGREGRRYVATAPEVSRLESVLEGQFQTNGVFAPATAAPGQRFACREINLGGTGPGCANLTAPDTTVARVKCALIARANNWFGGVPNPGTCP